MRSLFYVFSALALALTASACSGASSPTAPSQTPTPTPSTPTSITLNSEDGGPAVGVTVTIAGRSATTDATGTATFDSFVAPGAQLSTSGDGYLAHQCVYGGGAVHSHALIPTNTVDKETLRWLMFWGEYNDNTVRRLLKPGSIVLSPQLRANPAVVAAMEAAVVMSNDVHPTLPFHARDAGGNLLTSALPGTILVDVFVDPAATGSADAPLTIVRGEIVSAQIRFLAEVNAVGSDGTRRWAHELGHVFGLGHNPEPGLMGKTPATTEYQFSPTERRVVQYMLDRPPNTRWEDVLPTGF